MKNKKQETPKKKEEKEQEKEERVVEPSPRIPFDENAYNAFVFGEPDEERDNPLFPRLIRLEDKADRAIHKKLSP